MTNCKRIINIFLIINSACNIFCNINQNDKISNKVNNGHFREIEDKSIFCDEILKPFANLPIMHYVLDHEIGHAYVALRNGISVEDIKITGFQGYVKAANWGVKIIDLEVSAGGMAMELDHGEKFLRMKQKDGDIILKKLADNYNIDLNNKNLTLCLKGTDETKTYNVDCYEKLSGDFKNFNKEAKYKILEAFIQGVRNLYFKKKDCLFIYLKNILIKNNNIITSDMMKDIQKKIQKKDKSLFIFQDDYKINNDDILIALNLMKRKFPNSFKELSGKNEVLKIMKNHLNNNIDLYYLKDNNQIMIICLLCLILVFIIIVCQEKY